MFHVSSSRLAAASAVLVAALTLVGCSGGDDPSAGPTSSPPSPSPTRIEAEPVQGDREIKLFAVSNEQALWNREQPEPEQAAVEQFSNRVADWLDAHLSDLQEGGPGKLEDVAATGLLEGTAPDAQAAVTNDLASPERQVDSAAYTLLVAHTDAPQWIRATAQVTGRDGETRTAQFVFEVAEDAVALIAAGRGSEEAGP